MNNMNDNDIMDFIGESFRAEAEKTELPEALSKDNIVAMLKAQQAKEADEKPDIRVSKPQPRKHIYIGKYVTAAAALIFVIGAAVFISNSRMTKAPVGQKTEVQKPDSTVTGTTAMASITAVDPSKLEDNIIKDLNSITVSANNPDDKTPGSAAPVHREGEPVTRVSGLDKPDVQGASTSLTDKKIIDYVNSNGYSYRFASLSSTSGRMVEIVSLSDMSLAGTVNLSDYSLLAAGDLFEDILISGNNLVLIFDRGSSAAVVAVFDITDPSSPVLRDITVNSGSYINSCVSGTSFAVFTAVNSTEASVTVNSTEIDIPNESYLYDEDLGGTVYTLITVHSADASEPSVVLSGGKADKVAFSGNDIYVAVPYNSPSEGLSTEIKKLSYGENGWQVANYISVTGRLCSEINLSSGKLRFISANGNACTAFVLNNSLGEMGSAEFTCSVSSVSFIENYALVSGSAVRMINFSSSVPSVSTPENSDGFVNNSVVYVLDKMIIGASKPDNAGKIHWSIINSTGKCMGFSVDASLLTPNTSANAVSDEGNSVAAVPVNIKDCPGYLFFRTDGAGNISGEKSYAYDGSSTDSSVIIGDSLYVINESRIMSVSISEIFG